MNACRTELIDGYLDERLSPQDESALERHLETCAGCRQTIISSAGSQEEWQTVTQSLRPDELDTNDQPEATLWPLTLLGPTDDPRMLGRIGPFEVSACVGVGGMGVVFKARDPALDRYVAVKVLSPQLAASETARTRFAREAKAAAAIVHDNVIALHQVSSYNGLPYLVMPYLPGPSLEQRLRRNGPMPVVEALRVARQVAAGLEAAHAQGLIHRDIKPANILLSGETERAVLTDFGLARAVDDASLTRSGALAGTPQFMAPEQARGESTDKRSDIFSLGALLFAMLSGRPAVRNLSGAETVKQVGSQPPMKLSDVMKDAPRWLDDLVHSLHVFEPNKRMASAAEIEQTIAGIMPKAANRALQPRTVPKSGPAANGARRKTTALIVIGGLLGLLSWWGMSQPADEKPNPVVAAGTNDLRSQESASPGQASTTEDRSTETDSRPLTSESKPNEAQPEAQRPGRIVTAEETAALLADPNTRELDAQLRLLEQELEGLENR